MARILTLGDFCEDLGLPRAMVPEVYEILRDREVAQIAQYEAKAHQFEGRPDKAVLPLRDEEGDFGVLEARIPRTLFGNLIARKDFGTDGILSDEGLHDILRDHPECRVKTVSGRIVSGWQPGRKIIKKY